MKTGIASGVKKIRKFSFLCFFFLNYILREKKTILSKVTIYIAPVFAGASRCNKDLQIYDALFPRRGLIIARRRRKVFEEIKHRK